MKARGSAHVGARRERPLTFSAAAAALGVAVTWVITALTVVLGGCLWRGIPNLIHALAPPGVWGFYIGAALVFTPALVIGMSAMLSAAARLGVIPGDEPRCRVCGHALRGLSEPRCPACGTPI
jgi:hypothetical protein